MTELTRAKTVQFGFTAIELMVTVAVLGILLTVGIPAFADLVTKTRLTSQANDLLADLLYARSEAISRGVRVIVCPSADQSTCSTSTSDWNLGRIVFADSNGNDGLDANEMLVKRTALSGQSILTPSGFQNLTAIKFNSYGTVIPVGTPGSFKLCSPSSPNGRQIAVGVSGRPVITQISNCS